jgi:hypothetical protein
MQKFAHSDIESGLILWIKSFFYALEATKGRHRVVVSYELMLQESGDQLVRMHHELAMTTPLDMVEVDRYANDFIDTKLRHHEYTDDDLRMHPAVAVASICIKLHTFAMQLARDEIKLDSDEYHQAWQELKNELAKIQPMLDYIEGLRRKNKVLERQVRNIQKSIPWKMIYPLRVIDNMLRSRRKQSKRKLVTHEID